MQKEYPFVDSLETLQAEIDRVSAVGGSGGRVSSVSTGSEGSVSGGSVGRGRVGRTVGTSMGGAYAQQMRGVERICVNPSFDTSRLFHVLHVGKYKWLNERRDGSVEFHVYKETIEHFREMEAHQFDDIPEEDTLFCHGLFGDQDELTAGGREIFERHFPGMSRSFAGGHRLNAETVKLALLPLIRELLSL